MQNVYLVKRSNHSLLLSALLNCTRNNISTSTLSGPCGALTATVRQIVHFDLNLLAIVKTQRWPTSPFPYIPSSPFRFYGHARTVLRPTYVSHSRRSDTRRKRTALRERILFPLPECSTNVVARVMEVAEPAVRKPAAGGGCGRVVARSIQGGR